MLPRQHQFLKKAEMIGLSLGVESYLRISYATAWEHIERAIKKMRAALAKLQ